MTKLYFDHKKRHFQNYTYYAIKLFIRYDIYQYNRTTLSIQSGICYFEQHQNFSEWGAGV